MFFIDVRTYKISYNLINSQKAGTNAAVHWGTETPKVTPGDVNSDGKVNNQDAIYLLKHILDSEKNPLHNG